MRRQVETTGLKVPGTLFHVRYLRLAATWMLPGASCLVSTAAPRHYRTSLLLPVTFDQLFCDRCSSSKASASMHRSSSPRSTLSLGECMAQSPSSAPHR